MGFGRSGGESNTARKNAARAGMIAAAVALGLSGATPAEAASPVRTILNPVPEAGDNFARNIMTTPDGLIVTGSSYSDVNGVESGQAYVIDGQSGAVVHTLNHPEPANDTGFGAFSWAGDSKVAVSAPAMAVGGHAKAGVVYIFDLNTGAYLRKISNPTPGAEEDFGYGLGMLGDNVLIGSRGDDAAGTDVGVAYMYNAQTGALVQTFTHPEPTTQDNLGYTITGIGDNMVAIGAPGSDHDGTNSGRVYVYNASTGALLHTLRSPNPRVEGNFGFQVRARGKDIVVGAPGEQRAYVFDGTTGERLLVLLNPHPGEGSVMGSTVGSVGHYILVGDPLAPFAGFGQAGRAYMFNGNTGGLWQKFEDPAPGTEQRFGVSVAGMGGQVVISADQEVVNGLIKSGAVYVFNGPPAAAADWVLFE